MARLVCLGVLGAPRDALRALVLLLLAGQGSGVSGLAPEVPLLGSRRLSSSLPHLVAWSVPEDHVGSATAGGGVHDESRDVASTLHTLHKLSTSPRVHASIQTHEELRALLGGGAEGAREADRLMRGNRGAKKSGEGSDLFRRLLTAASQEQERRLGALRDTGFGDRSDAQATAATSRRQKENEVQLHNILTKMLDGLAWHDVTGTEAGGQGNKTTTLGVGGEIAQMEELHVAR